MPRTKLKPKPETKPAEELQVYKPDSSPETISQGLEEGWIQPTQPKAELKRLPLDAIKRDRKLQKRAEGTDQTVVQEYKEVLENGVTLPPVKVTFDGENYWLYDGYHSYSAAFAAGLKELDCLVTTGTIEEAEWESCAANQAHGLKRTNLDKQKAVRDALKLRPDLSDREIARHVGVDHKTVGSWRQQLAQMAAGEFPSKPKEGVSPGGHTLEELVELYAPIGIFRKTSDRKLRYELETKTQSHYFGGLDEAYREFPKFKAAYEGKSGSNTEATERPRNPVTGSVPFNPTFSGETEASGANLEGLESEPEATMLDRCLERRISGVQRTEWEELNEQGRRAGMLEYLGFEFVGNQDDFEDEFGNDHTPDKERRGWQFGVMKDFSVSVANLYWDGLHWSMEFGDEITHEKMEWYCQAAIDWVEWALVEMTGQMALPISEEQPTDPEPESSTQRERIEHDYYPTPDGITEFLLRHVEIKGQVIEPAAGQMAIAKYFYGCITNEPYPKDDVQPDYCCDASERAFWEAVDAEGGFDWAVANPPYIGNLPVEILMHAFEFARTGVAFLLRLSFLEPCENREAWLKENSDYLVKVIPINPRPKFRADVNGGDQVTVGWFIFLKDWSWKKLGIPCPFVFENWKKLSAGEA